MIQCFIVGNLTNDPELKTVSTATGEASVCNFTVAANRWSGSEKKTEFFRVSCWRTRAESCAKYLHKGSKVSVHGPVTARAYIGNDGNPRAQMEIQAEGIEFCSSRSDDQQETAAPAAAPETPKDPQSGYRAVENDDLPF